MKIRRSLLWRLLRNFLILSFVQVVLILIIARFLGLLETGYGNAYHTFSFNLEVRVEMLEKLFGNATRDLVTGTTQSSDTISRYLEEAGKHRTDLLSSRELQNGILPEIAQDLIQYLSGYDEIQGAFIALGQEPQDGEEGAVFPGVFILKDADISSDSGESQWYLAAGSPAVAEQNKLRYHPSWNEDLSVTAGVGNLDFFNMPMEQAASDHRYHYYISSLVRFHKNPHLFTTVTVPLMDHSGTPFGVMGVTLALGNILENISSISLSNVDNGFYLIAPVGDHTFRSTVSVSNKTGEVYLQAGEFSRVLVNEAYNIYRYIAPGREKMLVSSREIHLYDSESPYLTARTLLYGFAPESELLQDALRYRILIGVFFLCFITFSTLAIVFISLQISRPVRKLANEVSNIKNETELSLHRTGIVEIDSLLNALDVFSQKLIQTARRFSSIIELMDQPIGGFEEDPEEDRVYISDSVSRILRAPYRGKLYISMEEWQRLTGLLTPAELENEPDIYRYHSAMGSVQYIQLTVRKQGDRVLGLVVDVTNEVMEKIQLRTERDTDTLTGLYNRRKFQLSVSRYMENAHPEEIGAMVFFDLDNLKHVNDVYGHETGDRYLQAMAKQLDHPDSPSCFASRISGDEFAIFIFGYHDHDEVRAACRELFERILNTSIPLPDGTFRNLACSAGIAWFPDDAYDFPALLRYSDHAMYTVKHSTKNSYAEFDASSYSSRHARPLPQ